MITFMERLHERKYLTALCDTLFACKQQALKQKNVLFEVQLDFSPYNATEHSGLETFFSHLLEVFLHQPQQFASVFRHITLRIATRDPFRHGNVDFLTQSCCSSAHKLYGSIALEQAAAGTPQVLTLFPPVSLVITDLSAVAIECSGATKNAVNIRWLQQRVLAAFKTLIADAQQARRRRRCSTKNDDDSDVEKELKFENDFKNMLYSRLTSFEYRIAPECDYDVAYVCAERVREIEQLLMYEALGRNADGLSCAEAAQLFLMSTSSSTTNGDDDDVVNTANVRQALPMLKTIKVRFGRSVCN